MNLPVEILCEIQKYLYDLDAWHWKLTCIWFAKNIHVNLHPVHSKFSLENINQLQHVNRKFQKKIISGIIKKQDFTLLQKAFYYWQVPEKCLEFAAYHGCLKMCKYFSSMKEFQNNSICIDCILNNSFQYFRTCLNTMVSILPTSLAKIYAYLAYYKYQENIHGFVNIILSYSQPITNELLAFIVIKENKELLQYAQNEYRLQHIINLETTRSRYFFIKFYREIEINAYLRRNIAIMLIKHQDIWGLNQAVDIIKTNHNKTLLILAISANNEIVLNYLLAENPRILQKWSNPRKLHNIAAEYNAPKASQWLVQENIPIIMDAIYIAVLKNSDKYLKWHLKNVKSLLSLDVLYKFAQSEERKAHRCVPRKDYKIKKIIERFM